MEQTSRTDRATATRDRWNNLDDDERQRRTAGGIRGVRRYWANHKIAVAVTALAEYGITVVIPEDIDETIELYLDAVEAVE
jgi:hypothetical protein